MTEEIRILKTTSVLSIIVVITKFLQVLFLPIVASLFGTGGEFESFIIAFSISTLFSALVFGSFNTVFITIFSEYKTTEGEDSAWKFAESIIALVAVAFGITLFIGIVCSADLVSLFAPGRSQAFKSIGTGLTRLLFMASFFTLLLSVGTAILYSYKSFIVPNVAVLFGAIVLVITILAIKGGIGIYVMPLSLILSGAVSSLTILFFIARMKNIRFRFSFDFKHPGIKRAVWMLCSVSAIGIISQLNMVVNRFFASYLPEGNIAVLEYAYRVVLIVGEVLAVVLVVPLFQRMSVESVLNERGKVRDTFLLGVKMTAVVLLPLTVFILLLRMPIFEALLNYGKFTMRDTIEVSSVFLYLSLAMIGIGFGQIIGNAFFAVQKIVPLFAFNCALVVMNALFDLVFFKAMGVRGIALAIGLSSCITIGIAFWTFGRLVGGFEGIKLSGFMLKSFIASLLSGVSGWLLFHSFSVLEIGWDVWLIVKLCISAAASGILYVMLMSVFRVGEINFALDIIKEKITTMWRDVNEKS